MAWRVWGDPYLGSEFTDTSLYTRVTFNRNQIIIGMRTWVIFYNDPVLTAIQAKIYTDAPDETPGALFATSTNTLTKAEIITLENGVKEIFFTFDSIPVRANNSYHVVLNASGYTGSDSSHVAWMKAFPDPVYPADTVSTSNNIPSRPYQLYFIGSPF